MAGVEKKEKKRKMDMLYSFTNNLACPHFSPKTLKGDMNKDGIYLVQPAFKGWFFGVQYPQVAKAKADGDDLTNLRIAENIDTVGKPTGMFRREQFTSGWRSAAKPKTDYNGRVVLSNDDTAAGAAKAKASLRQTVEDQGGEKVVQQKFYYYNTSMPEPASAERGTPVELSGFELKTEGRKVGAKFVVTRWKKDVPPVKAGQIEEDGHPFELDL